MTKPSPDPPPSYADTDVEAAHSHAEPSSSTWQTILSHLPSTSTAPLAQRYTPLIPLSPLPAQLPSARMLDLAAHATTESERIAAIAAVPQLLAEEERIRAAKQKEALQLRQAKERKAAASAAASRERRERVCTSLWPVLKVLGVCVLVGGLLVGVVALALWVTGLPGWERIEGFVLMLLVLLVFVGIFAGVFYFDGSPR